MIHPRSLRNRRRHNSSRRLRLEALEQRQLLAADGLSLIDDSFNTYQNADPAQLDVVTNDAFDADYAGARQITSVTTASLGGRVDILAGGRLQYTPPADVTGVDVFRYVVDDLQSAEVQINISSPLNELTFQVDHLQTEYQLDLLAEADFPDGYEGAGEITLISETAFSSDLVIAEDGQSVLYRPTTDVAGKDSFTYIVDNLFVGSVRIDVSNPLANDDYEVIQNSGATTFDVLANDFQLVDGYEGVVSPVDWLSIRQNAQITHIFPSSTSIEVAITDDGRSVEFTPGEDAYGYFSFRYVVDSRFEQTASVRVHRPVQNDHFQADVNGGLHSFNVLTNDFYRSGQQTIRIVDEVTSVTQGDHGGTVEIGPDGKTLLYQPATDFVGAEQFDYVADGKHPATVVVTVTEPVRNDYFTVHFGNATALNVLENDFASIDSEPATVTSVGDSELGATLTIDDQGVIHYIPPENLQDYQSDTFTYVVNSQYTAEVRVNLRSVSVADSYWVDRPTEKVLDVLANDHFGENYLGAGVITSVSSPTGGGSLTISNDGQQLEYTPGSHSETFTYTVDDLYTETVRILPISRLRPDVAVADQNGGEVITYVLFNDFSTSLNTHYGPYTGPRVLSADGLSENGGVVEVQSDRGISYTPPADFVGTDRFEYQVDQFLTETVTVHVIRRAADDTVRVAVDSQSNPLNILANDIHGADYTEAGLISDVGPTTAGGEVTIAADRRSVNYTPAAGFTGQDSFVYTIDGRSQATVTVQVHDDDSVALDRFESTEQFRDFVLNLAVERYEHQFGQQQYVWSLDDLERSVATFSSSDTSSPVFSETNVQVAGVDEHDIVETDGFYIYTLRGNELMIVKSLPADELELVSRTLIEGTPVGMYLHGDRVTVISEESRTVTPYYPEFLADDSFSRSIVYPGPSVPGKTIVTVFDVAVRTTPTVVQRTEFEGRFGDSRRIDDQVFFVLTADALLPELESTCDDDDVCTYETEEEFVQRVTDNFAAVIEETLPSYNSYDGNGDLVRGGPLLMPEDIFRSSEDASKLTLVTSINMAADEPGIAGVAGVMGSSNSTFFASADSLYVFNNFNEPVENESWTGILRFDWDSESGAVEFAANGQVPGRMLNQFSADETDGQLRVVTEISNSHTGNHSGNAETAVFVLQADAGVLEFVGSMQNLALGSSVKSVRYFGDRVFVTTFDNVDPLYAIDLSDPSEPRTLGHVPIPGFNSYMQFVSPDRLLTVGTNTATGFGGRAMVSLFDVSDLNSPSLIDQFNLPRSSTSIANDDHHAFGWFANHELLSVPVSRFFRERYDADEDGYDEATRFVREDQLSVLHVGIDEDGVEGIHERGQVDHEATVRRSVSINDFVYSVGDDGIRAVNVEDANTVVDEVLFDWEIVVQERPWLPIDHSTIGAVARELVADEVGVSASELLLVTQEQRDGSIDLVLRSGDEHYRVSGTEASDLVLTDESFEFDRDMVAHNVDNPLDSNGDGEVSAVDALMVINEMTRRFEGQPAVDLVLRQLHIDADRFMDTNNDGRITAVDALRIINGISRQHASSN